jgi:hypothetical protein
LNHNLTAVDPVTADRQDADDISSGWYVLVSYPVAGYGRICPIVFSCSVLETVQLGLCLEGRGFEPWDDMREGNFFWYKNFLVMFGKEKVTASVV